VTEEFVQFRQVFGLNRFKLHRHLVDGTVKSVWLRQVFGLLRVRFRHVSQYSANPSYSFSPPNGNVIPPQTQPTSKAGLNENAEIRPD
jgi:hypothetical protein